MRNFATARCVCGSVELEARGAAITSVVCYCDDCQEGGRRIEALPNAQPVREPEGGTAYLVYRKDRLQCTKGSALLKGHKVREDSPTNRVVASCCNSAMILSFDDGKHWVSLYRARFQGEVLPVQMRICTKFKAEGVEIPNDVASSRGFPFKFLVKLVGAKIAMVLAR